MNNFEYFHIHLEIYLLDAIQICQNTMDNVKDMGFGISHPDYLQAYGAKWAYENVLERIREEKIA